jgi:hypothetical protein
MFSTPEGRGNSSQEQWPEEIELNIELDAGQLDVLRHLKSKVDSAIKEIAGIPLDSGIVSIQVGTRRLRINTDRNHFRVLE